MRNLLNDASSSFSFIYAPNLRNIKELEAYFVYLPTTFRSHFAAKFSMQIVNNAMHIVCIPAGHFRCIHPFRTVGDSNPALIINDFRSKNRACLRMFTNSLRAKFAGAIFACGGYFTFLMSGLKNLRNFTVVSYSHANCLCQSLRS